MTTAGTKLASPGYALMLLGFGHAAWGLVAYRQPLRELLHAGVVRSVGDGIFDTDHDRGARAAGFWFLAFAPAVALAGYLAEAALRAGDPRAARASGGTVLGMSAVGTAVMPKSGFPAAMPIGYWLLRRSRELASEVPR